MCKKKHIFQILVMFIGLITMTACGNQQGSAGANKDGSVTLRVVMKDVLPSDEQSVQYFEKLSAGLKEDKGIQVNFELIHMPSENYSERLNLMLMGGDIPDIIYFQGGDQPIVQQDLLTDLTPFIEESTYIQHMMEPHNKKRMENHPYLLWIKPLNSRVPIVRADWLEQLETAEALLEDPTVDNYVAFFREIVDAGLANYAITVAGDIRELDAIFDMAFGNVSTWLEDENGKFIFHRVSENEREKLAFYHKLYSEGLLDPEFLTKQWDTRESAFYDGEVGVITATSGAVIDLVAGRLAAADGSELAILPPASGVGQGFGPTDVTRESRGVAISILSPHQELAFQVLDYLASPNGQRLDRLGFEGVHYNVVDNEIELTEEAQQWFAKFWEPLELNVGMELATPLFGEAAQQSLYDAKEFYVEDRNFILPDEFIANWDAMENLYREFVANVITGKRPIEDFDQFVEQWYANGGEAITEYANKVLK